MRKILTLLFISIFLVQTVSALTFLNIYVDKNGQATFVGETSEQIDLPQGIKMQGSNIIGKTNSLTNKQGDLWSISYSLPNSQINLILPKGAVVKSISNGEIAVNKEQISIYFTDSTTITYTVEESIIDSIGISSTAILLMIIGAIIAVILIVFLLNIRNRDKEVSKELFTPQKKPDKLKIITKILSDREKSIVNELKQTGKIKQSQLRKLTKIPKASFSRHIQELEKKKLIKRTGEGKNKFVELAQH